MGDVAADDTVNGIDRPMTLYLHSEDDDSSDIQTVDIIKTLSMSNEFYDFDISEIASLQKCDAGSYYMSFHSEKFRENFETKYQKFQVNSEEITVKQASPLIFSVKSNYIGITIFGVPWEIDDEAIANKLEPYVEGFKDIYHTTFSSYPTIESGVRIMNVKRVIKNIPPKLYIRGQRVGIKYEGQQRGKLCYNCGKTGHLAKDCKGENKAISKTRSEFPALPKTQQTQNNINKPEPQCDRCGSTGHFPYECLWPIHDFENKGPPSPFSEPNPTAQIPVQQTTDTVESPSDFTPPTQLVGTSPTVITWVTETEPDNASANEGEKWAKTSPLS